MTATYRTTAPRVIRDPKPATTRTRHPHRWRHIAPYAIAAAIVVAAALYRPSAGLTGRYCGTPDGVTADRMTACMEMPGVR